MLRLCTLRGVSAGQQQRRRRQTTLGGRTADVHFPRIVGQEVRVALSDVLPQLVQSLLAGLQRKLSHHNARHQRLRCLTVVSSPHPSGHSDELAYGSRGYVLIGVRSPCRCACKGATRLSCVILTITNSNASCCQHCLMAAASGSLCHDGVTIQRRCTHQ